jgi:hypothetical protein
MCIRRTIGKARPDPIGAAIARIAASGRIVVPFAPVQLAATSAATTESAIEFAAQAPDDAMSNAVVALDAIAAARIASASRLTDTAAAAAAWLVTTCRSVASAAWRAQAAALIPFHVPVTGFLATRFATTDIGAASWLTAAFGLASASGLAAAFGLASAAGIHAATAIATVRIAARAAPGTVIDLVFEEAGHIDDLSVSSGNAHHQRRECNSGKNRDTEPHQAALLVNVST